MSDLFLAERFERDQPVFMSWSMMPGLIGAQVLGRTGFEAALIDMQHGLIGYGDMIAMVSGFHRVGKPVLVRPPLGGDDIIGKALDAGAAGLVVPMIDTPQEAAALVAKTKYPPLGERSWGAYLAVAASGLSKQDYLAGANRRSKTLAMIETATALANVEAICAVDHLDGIFVGPHDLCLSLTGGEAPDADHPQVSEALERIMAAARSARVIAGIYAATPELARRFAAMGFRLIAVGSDAGFLTAGADAALAALSSG